MPRAAGPAARGGAGHLGSGAPWDMAHKIELGQDIRIRIRAFSFVLFGQDGGEATFNQIAALLERMERVTDQWQARGAGAGAVPSATAPSPPSMSAPQDRGGAPSLPASALTSAASGSLPAMVPAGTAAGTAGTAAGPLAPSASPAQSYASEDLWRQTSGLGAGNLGEKEKKKKRKEGKESKEPKDLGPGDPGKGSEDGFPAEASGFGAWPDSGEASAFPESFGTPWGAPLGSSPAFEASNWATAATSESPLGPANPGNPGASGGSPFAAFGSSLPEQPVPKPGPGPNLAPSSLLSEKGEIGDPKVHPQGTLASLHLGFSFAAIEDKEAFERLFVRAAAQAAGVAPRRIRVHAVRPGPGY